MGENTHQNCTRQNKNKEDPGRQQPCWGLLFCTNLTQPTGNLDSKSSREIMEILRKLHTEGRTVILITHDDKIAQSAKRIIRIMDGKIESDSGMADKNSMEEENGEE
jgi:ABC-type transport system involved in cytochrome bd biosynthesis fused ATPase/permease subunit